MGATAGLQVNGSITYPCHLIQEGRAECQLAQNDNAMLHSERDEEQTSTMILTIDGEVAVTSIESVLYAPDLPSDQNM